MSIAKLVGVLGAGMGGYAAGRRQYLQGEEDRKDREQRREMNQINLDKARRQESDEMAIRGASEDTVVSDANAGPMPDGQVARVRGVGFSGEGDALAAKTAADAPEARAARRMGVLQTIDPERAAREKLTGLQVDNAEQEMADKVFLRSGAKALMSGGWQGLAQHLSDSPADGQKGAMKFVVVPGADGKTVRIAVADKDGKPTAQGMDFTDDEAGKMQALSSMMAVTNPAARLDHYRWEADRRRAQDNWEADFGLKKRQVANDERRTNLAATKLAGGGGSGAASAGVMGADGQPVAHWDDKADAFLREHYVTADEMTGAKVVDGSGMQFAKQVALAQSRRNGGDLTSALGYAFEADSAIRARMGNDPAKIKAERLRILQAMMRPAATEGGGEQSRPAAKAEAKPAPSRPAESGVAPSTDKASQDAESSWFMPTPKAGSKSVDQIAASMGFQPTSTRGNSLFGEGEVMYINPKTGERRWASQFK